MFGSPSYSYIPYPVMEDNEAPNNSPFWMEIHHQSSLYGVRCLWWYHGVDRITNIRCYKCNEQVSRKQNLKRHAHMSLFLFCHFEPLRLADLVELCRKLDHHEPGLLYRIILYRVLLMNQVCRPLLQRWGIHYVYLRFTHCYIWSAFNIPSG